MASWMVHLRIADKLLDRIPDIAPIEFIMGNMAPDSGLPCADGFSYDPPSSVSHFQKGIRKAEPDAFAAKYFTSEQRNGYAEEQYAFYLGYLTHLITDVHWSEQIAMPTFRRFIGGEPPYRDPMVHVIKEDWYDLDFKYLRDHPGFRSFRAYLGSVGFRNVFMEEFSADAFENRRQYITEFYLRGKEGLDREYPYLTEAEMDAFVDGAVQRILDDLHTKHCINL